MTNPSMLQFHNRHKGQTGILFATGYTLANYKPDEEYKTAVKLGVNRAYTCQNIELDYHVYGEPGSPDYPALLAYQPKLFKFEHRDYYLPPLGNVIYYAINVCGRLYKDIATYPCINHSVVYSAMQILLYMGCSKILLVGCDATYNYGSFGFIERQLCPKLTVQMDAVLAKWWPLFERWRKQEYPEVEVIAINPVLLHNLGFRYEIR